MSVLVPADCQELGLRVPDELVPISKAEGMFRLPGKVGTLYHFHVGDPASDGVLGNAFAFMEGGKLRQWYHFGDQPWARIAGVTAAAGDRQNALLERRSVVDGVLTVDLDEVEFGHNWAQVVTRSELTTPSFPSVLTAPNGIGVASSTSSNSKQPYATPGESASLTVASQITKQCLHVIGIQFSLRQLIVISGLHIHWNGVDPQ